MPGSLFGMMNKHGKIPRRKRKSFYTNSYSKIRVKEDLIADKLQVSYWGSCIRLIVESISTPNFTVRIISALGHGSSVLYHVLICCMTRVAIRFSLRIEIELSVYIFG